MRYQRGNFSADFADGLAAGAAVIGAVLAIKFLWWLGCLILGVA